MKETHKSLGQMGMADLILHRFYQDNNGTLGVLFVSLPEGYHTLAATLERPWVDNRPRISCIPPGAYDIAWEHSNKFRQRLIELKGVQGRSEIKIHAGNEVGDSLGCILVGDRCVLVPALRVLNSKNTLLNVHRFLFHKPNSLDLVDEEIKKVGQISVENHFVQDGKHF